MLKIVLVGIFGCNLTVFSHVIDITPAKKRLLDFLLTDKPT